ncbi:MAG: short chain dehydrogenase [Rhodobiaceae bacterium]|nr:short chain dehydrogenase [Rhodobiaceae bacterium]
MADKPENVLITGAAKRIGRAIAHDFAKQDWGVAIHYRQSGKEAGKLRDDIRRDGGRAICIGADLANTGEISSLVETACRDLGPLTTLINSASIFEEDSLATLTPESWAAHIDTNLRAPLFLTQAFVNQLPRHQKGNIINLIDQRVWRLTPRFLSYTASKAGLWTLTQTLAQGLAPHVRVNAIGPGPVLTNERQKEADFEAQVKATLLQRGPELDEICQAIRFILAAPSMTGQMIALDGGQHLAWATPDAIGPE